MGADVIPLDTLGATIKAHVSKGDASIEKAEQHYKAAGIHLMEAKERVSATPGLTWPAWLNTQCGIRRRRADELISIANGTTTLAEMRQKNRERVAAHRERKKPTLALRNAEADCIVSTPSAADLPLSSNKVAMTEGARLLGEELKARYRAVADTYREFVGDSSPAVNRQVEGAILQFMNEEIDFSDIVMMVEACAYERLNDFFGAGGRSGGTMSWRQHAADLERKKAA